ncbi:MAG: hypothetical protein Q8P41_25675 [Pseudomonadota bacterium]|nr:hypothetical protein [Pseudomonadota bacterium]
MSRLLRIFVALVVLFGLFPGGVEIFENLEHVIHDGHLAHAEDHLEEEQHGAASDEHGCTPMMHTCGCHASLSALPGLDALELAPPHSDEAPSPVALDDRPLASATAPPTPPPNA